MFYCEDLFIFSDNTKYNVRYLYVQNNNIKTNQ